MSLIFEEHSSFSILRYIVLVFLKTDFVSMILSEGIEGYQLEMMLKHYCYPAAAGTQINVVLKCNDK